MILTDANSWSFDLTQFDAVWKIILQICLLLGFLLVGNMFRKLIPFLRKGNVPSALIGGLLLFLANLGFEALGIQLVDKRIMQIITYHALAIGFAAMAFKTAKKSNKASLLHTIQNGALTGGTYMLQGALGIIVSLIFFWLGTNMFYDAGALLPLGFGQGPGNALSWDINFTAMENTFNGQGSVGLTIASIGFIVASIGGVAYINIFKHKKQIVIRGAKPERTVEEFEDENEISDSESVDKMSIQVAFVLLSYGLAFGIMVFFAKLTDWTGVGLFNSVAWGFNFIWCVITATLIKLFLNFLYNKKAIKQRYVNNYQMDRISGFAFDVMIVAGVAAIDIKVVAEYIWLIIALCVVGTIATFIYIRLMTKICFKGFEHEAFLTNFGALTGTASNGMIFLREIDPNYETPMNNVYIVSQFPAMVFVAPLLLLLNLSASSISGCYISLGIFSGLFVLYTVFMVLSGKGIIFKKKEKGAEQAPTETAK